MHVFINEAHGLLYVKKLGYDYLIFIFVFPEKEEGEEKVQ